MSDLFNFPRLTAIAAMAVVPLAATSAQAEPDPDPEPEAETRTELAGAMLETRVYFEFDKTELSERARVELDKAAAWFAANPDTNLVIEGHTDMVGDLAYNRRLSDARAEATRDYLIAAGLEPERIRLMPYGEALPAVSTDDRERANRRIHLYAVRKNPIVNTVTVRQNVPVTRTVERVVYEPVPVEARPLEYSLSAGGGVIQSLDGSTRDITDLGGTWNVRFAAGVRSLISAEIAYVGSAQDIDNAMMLGDDAAVVGNGAEGAFRVGLPDTDLQPYAFAGVGMSRYSVVNSDADLDDNVVFFPAGLGLAYRMTDLVIDVRGTARAAFDDDLFEGMNGAADNRLDNWSASAQVGWQF